MNPTPRHETRDRWDYLGILLLCAFVMLALSMVGCAHRETKPFDEAAYRRSLVDVHQARFASRLLDDQGYEGRH